MYEEFEDTIGSYQEL